VDFYDVGATGQCVSVLSPGQEVQFMTYINSSWSLSTSIASTSSVAYAIPVNGWVFQADATSTDSTTGAGPKETSDRSTANNNGTSAGLSDGAKIGLGVGISIGVLLIVGLIVALICYRRRSKPSAPTVKESSGQYNQYSYAPVDPAPYSQYEAPYSAELSPTPLSSVTMAPTSTHPYEENMKCLFVEQTRTKVGSPQFPAEISGTALPQPPPAELSAYHLAR
jgi:hypothetical protein